jgi:PIN domain nuclease of toxin-antitoxin system
MTSRVFLLDTHIVIWALNGDARLPAKYIRIIEDGSKCYVSIASLWEIAIKQSLGKLDVRDDIVNALEEGNIELLPVSTAAIRTIRTLPHHHRDPFDRMLIAQAIAENLSLLTVDRHFALYGVTIA